ncbi:MAG: vanadium-dependent haloperoxidase, partial [Verrucomicrobiota bacterium]
RKLLAALRSRNQSAWQAIPLDSGASRKLANPQASLAYSLTGGDSFSFFMRKAPEFGSAEEASEMGEVYLHALLREIPFEEYANPGDSNTADAVNFAVNQMNLFSDFRGPKIGGQVAADTLFRGSFAGDLVGNYVSQFLLLDVPMGAGLFPQLYETTAQGDDHMNNQSDWINILRGGAPATSSVFDPTPRYVYNARGLGEFVHRDYTYQTYLQAALILLGMGAPLNPKNPYTSSANQGGFVTFGPAEVLSLVSEACLNGLKAAWYHKWQVHRRLRPEVFGGRIHRHKSGLANYPINNEILNSAILDGIEMTTADRTGQSGQYWLPMAYPEGSPTHPAYPAGHATVSGACCTMLKALFDESYVLPSPVEVDPSSYGTALRPFSGSSNLTVGGELDKLANNIAIGRNMAGVHWRTDGTEGVLLGEQVAISLLRDYKLTYNERFQGAEFTGFQGNTIRI